MFKKLSFILVLSILITIFAGVPACAEDVEAYLESVEPDSEYDGFILKLAGDADVSGLDDFYEIREEEGLFQTDSIPDILELADDGLIEYIEPDYEVTLFSDYTGELSDYIGDTDYEASLFTAPNDSYYPRQWNLTAIGAEAAWDAGLTASGVRVGVIDSGINRSHEDFVGVSILAGKNLIDGSTNVTDNYWHGTFVSGVIAAKRDNGKGIAGIADGVTLVPLKCFESETAYASNIIAAVYAGIDDFKCTVLNMSFGLDENLFSMEKAMNYAESKNVLVISAVGNDGVGALKYPAAYGNVVGVGSMSRSGTVSSFSQRNASVFVVAPGEGLVGLDIAGSAAYVQGAAGTSYSAPHVTAMAAIAKSLYPDMDAWEFMETLAESSSAYPISTYDYGYGLVSVSEFVDLLTAASYSLPDAYSAYRNVVTETVYYGYPTALTYNLGEWFNDSLWNGLSYSVYSSTAYGDVSISGNILSYTPAAADADKNIRIVIAAYDGMNWSENNASLTVKVAASDYDLSSAQLFSDVKSHWAEKYIAFGVDIGLLNGVGDGRFEPDIPMTRAMFVTVLGRLYGAENAAGCSTDFPDIPEGSWYGESAAWAQSFGLITGISGKFEPNLNITREQLAQLMYRYAMTFELSDGSYDTKTLYGFTDTGKISSWAVTGVNWAVSNGLISGKAAVTLDPQGQATRAEVAAILVRFIRTFQPEMLEAAA